MAKKKTRKSSFRGKVRKDVEKQKRENSGFGYLNLPEGIKLYKPTPGERESFDVLPYEITDKNHPDINKETGLVVGELWYKRPFRVHKNVGAQNDTYVCLTSFGEPCPICEYRARRAKEGASPDELQAFNSSRRNLYAVIPRGVAKTPEKVHVFDFSQFLFQDLLNQELNEDEDYEVFPEPEEGYTLKVRWDEKSFNKNTFAQANRIDFKEREEVITEEELEDVPNLDELLKRLSYEELEARLFEIDLDKGEQEEVNSSDEDDDDEKPRKKKSSKKKPEPETEEDDDEEEEEEEPDLTGEDLVDMEETELAEVVEEYELDIDVEDYDEEGLREAIAEELEIELPKKKTSKAKKTKKTTKDTKQEKKSGKSKETTKKCPVKGGVFGETTDDFKQCDDCKWYDDCEEEFNS